jgi:hypothetical protein
MISCTSLISSLLSWMTFSRDAMLLATQFDSIRPCNLINVAITIKSFRGSSACVMQKIRSFDRSRMERDTVQSHPIHYNTLQYITIHYNTLQYITINYNTLQYITIQYITLQS